MPDYGVLHKGQGGLFSSVQFGSRLREERRAKGMNQGDFARLAGITLQTQSRYEQGTTECGASYLAALSDHDVDVLWVISGRRGGATIDEDQTRLLDAFSALQADDRESLLRLACSLAGRPRPARPQSLPNEAVLVELLQTFLEVTPTDDQDALARELAMSLPTMLQAAEGARPAPAKDQTDTATASATGDGADRRAIRQGQRT